MRRFVTLLLLLAACGAAAHDKSSIELIQAPFPPAGSAGMALCPGEDPCADGQCATYDLAAGCWVCDDCALAAAVMSFKTWDAPSGTDPVADTSADTMLLEGAGVSITGDAALDKLTFANTGALTGFVTWNAPAGTDPVASLASDTMNLAVAGPIAVTGDAATKTLTWDCPTCVTTASELWVNGANGTYPLNNEAVHVTAAVDAADDIANAGFTNVGGDLWASHDIAASNNFYVNAAGAYIVGATTTYAHHAITDSDAFSITAEGATIELDDTAGDDGVWLYGGSDPGEYVIIGNTAGSASRLRFPGSVFMEYEGTVDAFETTFAVTDPTADRTITFPNATGTVPVTASSPIAISAAGDITCATCETTANSEWINTTNTYPRANEPVHVTGGTDTAETITNANYTDSGGSVYVALEGGFAGEVFSNVGFSAETTRLVNNSLTFPGDAVIANLTSDAFSTIIYGGQVGGAGTGARIELWGDDSGNTGTLNLYAGNGTNVGNIVAYVEGTGSYFQVNGGAQLVAVGSTGLVIGASGTAISDSYAGSATIDFASSTTTTVDSSAITVTGAALGDVCSVGTDAAATWVTGASFTCYVSAADNVKVRFTATGANINPGSDTFRVRVFDP